MMEVSMDVDDTPTPSGGGVASAAPAVVSSAAVGAAVAAAAAGDVAMGASGAGSAAAEKPSFPALTAAQMGVRVEGGKIEYRRVRVPHHRYTPLREEWETIVTYLVEHMKLQVRMNPKKRTVELKTSLQTPIGHIQKGADFLHAFMLGFAVQDAVALLRLDDLFVDSFEINDVKMLKGDHLSRAIGRIAGQGGKTKNVIENATRTRIVVADTKIHILGAFANIKVAKDTICSLILGAPPGKVYNNMRHVAARLQQRM